MSAFVRLRTHSLCPPFDDMGRRPSTRPPYTTSVEVPVLLHPTNTPYPHSADALEISLRSISQGQRHTITDETAARLADLVDRNWAVDSPNTRLVTDLTDRCLGLGGVSVCQHRRLRDDDRRVAGCHPHAHRHRA